MHFHKKKIGKFKLNAKCNIWKAIDFKLFRSVYKMTQSVFRENVSQFQKHLKMLQEAQKHLDENEDLKL